MRKIISNMMFFLYFFGHKDFLFIENKIHRKNQENKTDKMIDPKAFVSEENNRKDHKDR